METMYLVGLGSIAALAFAGIMFTRVRRESPGSEEMKRISDAVSRGAGAYLKRQYRGVGIFFAVVFVILLCMSFAGLLSFFTPFAFLTGGFFSGKRYGLYRGRLGTFGPYVLVFPAAFLVY